ncbi:MAG: hypothetical protein ACFFD2_13290 [Promethearchaeota archaeon]
MNSKEISEEFQELLKEIHDPDSIVRGMAAIDLGSFASDHIEYKDRTILILQDIILNDLDDDVRKSAQNSILQLQGKTIESSHQVIGFGYVPQEYQKPEVNQKQMIISCVCCIFMIVIFSCIFIFLF